MVGPEAPRDMLAASVYDKTDSVITCVQAIWHEQLGNHTDSLCIELL